MEEPVLKIEHLNISFLQYTNGMRQSQLDVIRDLDEFYSSLVFRKMLLYTISPLYSTPGYSLHKSRYGFSSSSTAGKRPTALS